MATRNAQTWAKRAREQAVKERRDRKRARKADAAAARAAGEDAPQSHEVGGEEDTLAPTTPESTAPAQE
jgi:hypothetical protein